MERERKGTAPSTAWQNCMVQLNAKRRLKMAGAQSSKKYEGIKSKSKTRGCLESCDKKTSRHKAYRGLSPLYSNLSDTLLCHTRCCREGCHDNVVCSLSYVLLNISYLTSVERSLVCLPGGNICCSHFSLQSLRIKEAGTSYPVTDGTHVSYTQ